MTDRKNDSLPNGNIPGCSCCGGKNDHASNEISRRKFVQVTGTSALGTEALSGISWAALASAPVVESYEIRRKSLVVKPVFTYEIPVRREQTSWRAWGGIQTEADADQEILRISDELKALKSKADLAAEKMPGFHWITVYGDYLKESGYALKKLGINFETLA